MSVNFDNKHFIDAPTSLQGDLNSLINNSTMAYALSEIHENQTTALARRTRWNNIVYGNNTAISYGAIVSALLAGLCMLGAFFTFAYNLSIDGIPNYAPSVAYGIAAGACAMLGNKLWQQKRNQFIIEISNYNDECYQFRFMPDNKLYILAGANFDENGVPVATNAIVELEPVCSDIIIMDAIHSIRQFEEGAVIRGKATIKSFRVSNGVKRYMQLSAQQYITVFLQRGIYQEEMLNRIAQSYGVIIK